jgi:hypothetical protein
VTAAKTKTLRQKIAAASAKMDNPVKRSANPHYGSKFANLRDTMDIVEPVLDELGLAHIVYFNGTTITYEVFDPDTGEVFASALDLKDILAGLDKNPWQSIGQAFTYLRRYLMQAFWGMIPLDDDAQSAPSRTTVKRKDSPLKEFATPVNFHGEEMPNGGGGSL